ncbi:MAG: hypothetical protein VW417_01925, partial [Alphaproteobacteria bacterium]
MTEGERINVFQPGYFHLGWKIARAKYRPYQCWHKQKLKEKLMKMNVGLIGTGFMGKAHVFGFATARRVFNLPIDFHMEMVADASELLASAAGKS